MGILNGWLSFVFLPTNTSPLKEQNTVSYNYRQDSRLKSLYFCSLKWIEFILLLSLHRKRTVIIFSTLMNSQITNIATKSWEISASDMISFRKSDSCSKKLVQRSGLGFAFWRHRFVSLQETLQKQRLPHTSACCTSHYAMSLLGFSEAIFYIQHLNRSKLCLW